MRLIFMLALLVLATHARQEPALNVSSDQTISTRNQSHDEVEQSSNSSTSIPLAANQKIQVLNSTQNSTTTNSSSDVFHPERSHPKHNKWQILEQLDQDDVDNRGHQDFHDFIVLCGFGLILLSLFFAFSHHLTQINP